MSKVVLESNYRRFKPVGQEEKCADCPSGCKTSCARKLMDPHDLTDENKESQSKNKK